MIQLVDVRKNMNEEIILNNINLSIENGEFVFVIGKSGSGKTTLLKILALQIEMTDGNILIDQKLINQNNKNRVEINRFKRNIRFIFQDFRLIQNLNVFENIAYPLEIQGIYDRLEIKKKVLEVLEIVDLTCFEKKFSNQLSGGEKQRVAIARALTGDSKLIIADEPTANLDPDNSDEIMNYLEKINELGQTVVMATHNSRIVDKYKHRVIELNDGQIIRDGEKGQYYEI